jgi:hypothetical protein
MKGPSWVAGAVLVAALAVTHESAAEDSYAAPLLGVTGGFGARSGWGGPDAAIFGVGLFAGGRWGAWRAGVLGDVSSWRADPGVAVDVGGFVSGDVAAIWLDPAISAAWFVRVEPTTFRWVSSTSRWAYAPALGTGVRAAGWEIGIAGRPEFGFEAMPNGGSRMGVDIEWGLGVDLVEFGRLLGHVSDSKQPLAP